MPLKKGSVAYEARLARRRAQRKIDKLETQKKQAGVGTRHSMYLQTQINELKNSIAGTYQRKQKGLNQTVRSAEQVRANIRNINVYRPPQNIQRKNMAVMRELNKAGSQAYSTTATKPKYSEGEMHIFYAATIRAWQGNPASERAAAIMQYYNVVDLEDFIAKVLERNDRAIKIYNGEMAIGDMLKDSQDELYGDFSIGDSADSEKYDALYMSYIVEAPRDLMV